MKKFLLFLYILFLMFVLSGYGASAEVNIDIRKIVRDITPSIVKVVVQDGRRYIASGIAIDRNLVVSNAKVASHPFKRILLFDHRQKSYEASIVGKDRDSSVILLKTESSPFVPLKAGKLPETGDWVGLAGVFYRSFPYFKSGIVSSVNDSEIILNATVMPGTAGGAVVNRKGELIGLIRGMIGYRNFPKYIFKDNSSELTIIPKGKSRGDQCYAIAIPKVNKIIDELRRFGYVRRGWLGINISGKNGKYVVVENVEQGSPAAKYGIKRKDIILKIGEKRVKNASVLAGIVKNKTPGDKVVITLKREGKLLSVPLKLGDLKDRRIFEGSFGYFSARDRFPVVPELFDSLPMFGDFSYRISKPVSLKIDTVPLTPELAVEFQIPGAGGLLVSRVRSEKIASSGLRVGDIIVKVNKQDVKTPDDLKRLILSRPGEEPLKIEFYRKGRSLTANIKPEIMADENVVLNNFKEKLREMRFWMEQAEKRRLKKKLEKLKELEKVELMKKSEKREGLKERLEIEREKGMLKKEYLERVRAEIKKLKFEMQRIERELKRKKKKGDSLPDC